MNPLALVIEFIQDILRLFELLAELRFEHGSLTLAFSLSSIPILVLGTVIIRNLHRSYKATGFSLRFLVALPLYILNLASKFLLITLLVLLFMNPYILRPQTITVEEAVEGKFPDKGVAVIILIDCSNSMWEKSSIGDFTKFELAKNVAQRFLKYLLKNDTAIIAFFADTVVNYTRIGASINETLEFLSSFNKAYNYTSIGNALSFALSLREALQKPTAILLVSDGGNNGGVDPISIAEDAMRNNVTIFTVFTGGGEHSNPFLLLTLSRKTNGTFFDASNLNQRFLETFSETINRKVRYLTLRKNIGTEVTILYRDYETPFKAIVKALFLVAAVMFLTGV
ncbi:MAG: VWA domain-containing protein [Thermoproteales archaeon]|nr:VWA domain-containing protein [Thermoproteales archaeon]